MPPNGNHRDRGQGDADLLNEDGALDTPLHQLPGFGTGLHRRPVAFVAASPAVEDDDDAGSAYPGPGNGAAVASAYLSLVLGDASGRQECQDEASPDHTTICDVCGIAVSSVHNNDDHHDAHAHHSSLVHQLARGRPEPPPAAVDRRRFGFAVLAAQGWDPDSADTGRRGLGPTQQGRARALAPRPRPARAGLGAEAPDDTKAPPPATAPKPKIRRSVRRRDEAARQRRAARLQEQLLGHRDLDRYLAPQDEWV